MTNNAFLPANILLPSGIDMTKWSVVACDQFTSERSYWDRVTETVGASPSTLKLIVPEAYLDETDPVASAVKIGETMDTYLQQGLFQSLDSSYVYIERTVSDGQVRRGLVGMIDLDAYDYTPGADSLVRASEKTIVTRLPARVETRRKAPLELPHIMALINDAEFTVIEPLTEISDRLEAVYDFELMENGGRVRGWRVTGEDATALTARLSALTGTVGVQMVIGDGNHSLAAAKNLWDELKPSLTVAERDVHPARFALAELNNIYDTSIGFEPIHRLITGVDAAELLAALDQRFDSGDGTAYTLQTVSAAGVGRLTAKASDVGSFIAALQSFLDDYAAEHGASIDYIHGDASLLTLGAQPDAVGLLMPSLDKSDFFATVIQGGVFPKKSFSIGSARDKRYYLECRAIRPNII